MNQAEELAGKRFIKHSEWLSKLDEISKTSSNKEVVARAESLARALLTLFNIREAPSNKQHEYHKAKQVIGMSIVTFLEEHS